MEGIGSTEMVVLDPTELLKNAEEALALADYARKRGFPDIASYLNDVATRYRHMAEHLLRKALK
jgi:hypothetical protein